MHAGRGCLSFFSLIQQEALLTLIACLSRITSARPSHRKQGGCRIGGAGVSWTPGPCPYGIPSDDGLAKTL